MTTSPQHALRQKLAQDISADRYSQIASRYRESQQGPGAGPTGACFLGAAYITANLPPPEETDCPGTMARKRLELRRAYGITLDQEEELAAANDAGTSLSELAASLADTDDKHEEAESPRAPKGPHPVRQTRQKEKETKAAEMTSSQNATPLITALSLGWGLQSLTLAAMSALEHLPKLDAAIHADTGHENPYTYQFAERWTPWLEERGIRVITVKPGNNSPVRTDWGKGSVQIPAFTKSRKSEATGQVKRQCTRHWKITPIRAAIRELAGNRRLPPGAVEQWQGITIDEYHRARSSDVKYIVNRYPLSEMRMKRADCAQWLERNGIEIPPKSACVFCPFQSKGHWSQMKRTGGETWQKIIAADESIRQAERANVLYLHPNRLPIQAAVNIPEDEGAQQLEMDMPCDGGACFV